MSGDLVVEDLYVRFAIKNSWLSRIRGTSVHLTAVDGVSFTIGEGRSLGIVGESGCGKSTVARALVGLVKPASGTITYDGQQLGTKRTQAQRRAIQMVFQDPGSSLNPSLSVRQILSELLKVHDRVPRNQIDARCAELLDLVEMPERFLDVRPRAMSGGQRQRIGIARALALDPAVLIADESVAALDVSVQASVLNLLDDLRERLNLTLMFISHDLGVVRHISEDVLVMYLGGAVEYGRCEDIFDNPQHPYTQALLASAPSLKRDLKQEVRLLGEPPSPLDVQPGCRFVGRCPVAIDVCHDTKPELVESPSGRAACLLVGQPTGAQ